MAYQTPLTSSQKKAVSYKKKALETIPLLPKFFIGNIPEFSHYKRMNVPYKKAVQIAQYGYLTALRDLNVHLYFTQALLLGCAVLGTYHNVSVVLPSQYGKSFVSACISIELAYRGEEVSIGAFSSELTKKIMSEVRKILPRASEEIKKKLTTPLNEFEKMQTSLSRNAIGFIGGGKINAMTLGGKFSNSIEGNQMVGQSGNSILDESAMIPDNNYAETGRSEVAYRLNGKPFMSMEISNPHKVNHFYRSMTVEPIPAGHLIVWADIRISMEEGKQKYYELDKNLPKLETSKFFLNEGTCISYLLSEFGAMENGSFFSTKPIVNNKPVDLTQGTYVLGLDSASRGADSIMGALVQLPEEDMPYLRVVDLINFKPATWVDFETPQEIEDTITLLCKKVNIKAIIMDLGGGEFIHDRLGNRFIKEKMNICLQGIYFHSKTTRGRIRSDFNAKGFTDYTGNGAEIGSNKRAEMYLDLRELINTKKITFVQRVMDILESELVAVGTEKYSSGGKVLIEDKVKGIKKKLGHSPDSLDATVMGIHAYVLYTLGFMSAQNLKLY